MPYHYLKLVTATRISPQYHCWQFHHPVCHSNHSQPEHHYLSSLYPFSQTRLNFALFLLMAALKKHEFLYYTEIWTHLNIWSLLQKSSVSGMPLTRLPLSTPVFDSLISHFKQKRLLYICKALQSAMALNIPFFASDFKIYNSLWAQSNQQKHFFSD